MTDLDAGQTYHTIAESSPKRERTGPTKADLRAVLASFEAPAPQTETYAEKERKRRIAVAEKGVRDLAASFQGIGVADGNTADAVAAFKSLQAALKKATASIEGLPDTKLIAENTAPPSKATRTPRSAKPAAEAVEAPPAAPAEPENDEMNEADVEAQAAAPAEELGNETTPDELDQRLKAQRAARSGPSFNRTDPAFGEEARGPVDPNSNDGF